MYQYQQSTGRNVKGRVDGETLCRYARYIIHVYLFVCLHVHVHVGVGGIEAEAVMLGQSISMVLPKVVGYKLTGNINPLSTSTDVVLTITKVLLYMHTYHVHV